MGNVEIPRLFSDSILFHSCKDLLELSADGHYLFILAVANRRFFKRIRLQVEQPPVTIELPSLVPDKAARLPDAPAGVIVTEYPFSGRPLFAFYLRQEAPAVNSQVPGDFSPGNPGKCREKITEIYQIITYLAWRRSPEPIDDKRNMGPRIGGSPLPSVHCPVSQI